MTSTTRSTPSTAAAEHLDSSDNLVLSELIGAIYDAALDATRWMDVITRVMTFIDGIGASLYTKNAARPSGHIHYVTGIAQDYQDSYFQTYVAFDPTTMGQFFAEIDQPIGIEDIMPYAYFTDTRFYQEWVRPQGIADCLNTVLDKSVTNVAMFGVFRKRVADARARQRMRLIALHIRRAVMIGRMFDLKSAEAASFADAFDGLGTGMFLLATDGRVVHGNAAGLTLLDAADGLRMANGRLAACDPQADRTLREAFAACGQGDAALGTKAIAVPLLGKSGDHYVAHLLPDIGRAAAGGPVLCRQRRAVRPQG